MRLASEAVMSRTSTVAVVRSLAGVGLLVLMTGWGYPAAADQRSGAVCRSWKVVPGPDVTNAQLNAVSGASRDDVWAVGYSYSGPGPLVEHWDGTAWALVTDASPGGPLNGVVAIS